jgi:hypothetical protein
MSARQTSSRTGLQDDASTGTSGAHKDATHHSAVSGTTALAGPESRPTMCDVADTVLQCRTEHADRFVYSKQFIPLRLQVDGGAPLLTFYQAHAVKTYLANNRGVLAATLGRPEIRDMLARAGVPALDELTPTTRPPADLPVGGVVPDDAAAVSRDLDRLATEHRELRHARIVRDIADVEALLRVARGAESVPAARELSGLIADRMGALVSASAELRAATNAEVVYGEQYGLRPTGITITTAAPDPVDILINLLKSDIGYLFFDRTRIRPSGFAVGEHLYALSLAPGEEVVMEQKTFSKRQITFEEQTEEEKQQDIELSSTLSTELQEGAERQRNRTNSSGFTAGGTLGANIDGVEVSANLGSSTNLTEASNETRTRSVKENTSSTQRVAAKYRAAHKVSFRVSTEAGFEASSRRVLRNPNRFTPMNLHYFKIMQVLDLMQQRYGVRLAWAPNIKDPGFDFYDRIRKGREAILAKASEIALPPKPTPPVKPDQPVRTERSALTEADKWGVVCDMRYDYTLEISIPTGYIWDGNAQVARDSLQSTLTNISRGTSIYVIGDPWVVGDTLMVKVHVGVDWKNPIGGCGTIYLTVAATFNPDPAAADPAYQAAYAQYLADLAAWQSAVAAKQDAALEQARTRADAWEAEMLRNVNPLGELMNRVISHEFAPATRDEAWEIELWQQIFDWSAASFVLYPAWWSDLPMRDPLRSPTDFFNASWAKLYVPVKIGFERMALRWIFGKQVQTPLSAAIEAAFTKLEAELKSYRQTNFGDERETGLDTGTADCATWNEKFLCLARWTDVLPTDGTHLEVVQSATSAADQYSRAEVEALRAAQRTAMDSALQDIELKKKGVAGIKKEIGADVHIVVGDGGGTV